MDVPVTHSQEEQVPQKTPTRKRQIDSSGDERKPPPKRARQTRKRQINSNDDPEPQPKRARLTRKNLTCFNKMGGKKGSKTSGLVPAPSTGRTPTNKTTSTTSSGFAIQARKNGILDPPSSKPPTNLEDLRKRYARTRETASPPESTYRHYVSTVGRVPNEATMVFKVGGKLLKEYEDEGYDQAFNQAFTDFPTDVGVNNGLSAPQPDFVEGLEMEKFLPFPVDEQISGAVLYKDNPHSLTLPHLAGEWKGPDGAMKEARMQAAYDGAALVYGRNQALAYLETPDPPGHAGVTTFTTDGTQLNLFSHHAATTDDGALEYHQYPLKSISLLDSHEGFKEGHRHLRNAQDHAREESCRLRDDLRSHWRATRDQPAPLPTIADEDGYEVVTQQPESTYGYETGYETVEPQPAYQPEEPTSTKSKKDRRTSSHSYSTRSSTEVAQPTHDHASSSSHKKKTSSSHTSTRKSSHTSSHKSSHTSSHKTSGHSSKPQGYWKKDRKTGGYYHEHGAMTRNGEIDLGYQDIRSLGHQPWRGILLQTTTVGIIDSWQDSEQLAGSWTAATCGQRDVGVDGPEGKYQGAS